MTKTKSTKRALLMSALALLMCVSMLIGSTFAWFTDEVTSAGNKIVAGNLDIALYQVEPDLEGWMAGTNPNPVKETEITDSSAPIFGEDILWEPGYEKAVSLKLQNNGNLALQWQAVIRPTETIGELAEVIDVYLLKGNEMINPANGRDYYADKLEKIGTLADVFSGNAIMSGTMTEAGAVEFFSIVLKMQETAGNEYQGKTAGAFDITVLATQYTYEKDSFDDQYDKDANISDAAAFIGTVDGSNLALNNDVTYYNTDPEKQMILEATDVVNFDGNGNTITTLGADPSVGNHGYVAFIPAAGEDATVSDLTVTGTGFVEVGHWGIGGGDYTVNNLTVKDIESTLANADKGFTLACGFCHYGDAVLNDCVMTGTTNMIDGAMPVDLGCVNDTTTVINRGEYGTIYCWSHSVVTIDGAEVDTLQVAPIKGTVTVKAGTSIKTLNVDYGTSDGNVTKERLEKLVIEDGATVEAIVFRGVTYTVAEWNAFVASF